MKELKMEIAKIKYNLRWLDLILLSFPLDYVAQNLCYLNIDLETKTILVFCWQIISCWLIFYIVPKKISKLIIKLSPAHRTRKILSRCNVFNGMVVSGLLLLKLCVKTKAYEKSIFSVLIVWLIFFGLYMLFGLSEEIEDKKDERAENGGS